MLSDPITVAANSPTPALSLALVETVGFGSVRYDSTNKYGLSFNHSSPTSTTSNERHYMQLSQTVNATDLNGNVSVQTAKVSLSVTVPPLGWTQAQKVALVQALLDTLNDSDVTITKFLSFQS